MSCLFWLCCGVECFMFHFVFAFRLFNSIVCVSSCVLVQAECVPPNLFFLRIVASAALLFNNLDFVCSSFFAIEFECVYLFAILKVHLIFWLFLLLVCGVYFFDCKTHFHIFDEVCILSFSQVTFLIAWWRLRWVWFCLVVVLVSNVSRSLFAGHFCWWGVLVDDREFFLGHSMWLWTVVCRFRAFLICFMCFFNMLHVLQLSCVFIGGCVFVNN